VVKLSEIVIDLANDARGENVDLDDLLNSLPEIGMLNPISVRGERQGKFVVVAGHRRLRAARKLGWSKVPVNVISLGALREELARLDENLVRQRLPRGEEALQMARAKAIYEELHPETRHGGPRHGSRRCAASRHNDGHQRVESFTARQAKAMGRSRSKIERSARLGERGSAKVLAALDEGMITEKEALRLASISFLHEDQDRALEKLKEVKGGRARHSHDPLTKPGLPNRDAATPTTPTALTQTEAVYVAVVKLHELTGAESVVADHEQVLSRLRDASNVLEEIGNVIRRKHPVKMRATSGNLRLGRWAAAQHFFRARGNGIPGVAGDLRWPQFGHDGRPPRSRCDPHLSEHGPRAPAHLRLYRGA
jgi:ParB-like chromosome segregation protein Spo0J